VLELRGGVSSRIVLRVARSHAAFKPIKSLIDAAVEFRIRLEIIVTAVSSAAKLVVSSEV